MTDSSGIVGEYYVSETGRRRAEHWPERESDEAWQQVSPTKRVKVKGKRIGHATCVWENAIDDLPPGMAH